MVATLIIKKWEVIASGGIWPGVFLHHKKKKIMKL